MFTHNGDNNYYSFLQQLTNSYNNSVHSSIKMKPNDVNTSNQNKVWLTLYGMDRETKSSQRYIAPKLNINDFVRISKLKYLFTKGYEAGWSNEIFTIHKIIPREPAVYLIRDGKGEIIEGTFYEEELQRVYK